MAAFPRVSTAGTSALSPRPGLGLRKGGFIARSSASETGSSREGRASRGGSIRCRVRSSLGTESTQDKAPKQPRQPQRRSQELVEGKRGRRSLLVLPT